MSTHDAVEAIWQATHSKTKWVLDADITGCYDNIDQKYMLNQMDEQGRPLISEWLKAGYMEEGYLHTTEKGTPQGGVISPVLANIALDNMERDIIATLRKIKVWKTKAKKLKIIRYADDFVVIHEEKEVIAKAQEIIMEWLSKRGLELSPEKTLIVHTTEGFDFLGMSIKHYKNNKIKGHYKRELLKTEKGKRRVAKEEVLQITPSKPKTQKHKDQIKEGFGQMKMASQDALIKRLNPVIRGWANYYRYVDSWETFTELDKYLWKKLWSWARRRHPKKKKGGVREKYFSRTRNRSWDFTTKDNQIQGYAQAKAPTGSFVKVRSGKSYYDGDTAYWASRLRKGYDTISPSQAKLLKKQEGQCTMCGAQFKSEDLTEAHHIKAKSEGGKDEYSNLALVHRHCHDQFHAANVGRVKKKPVKKKGLLARLLGAIL